MGEIENKDYEIITARCDECDSLCTFNRIDDIGDPGPYYSGRYVSCTECGRPFWIFGDATDPAYELLIFEAEQHMRAKHYMLCVTSLAQAWEMFFATFVYSNYLYRPFYHEASYPERLERFDGLAEQLGDAIRNVTFDALRNVLVNTVVEGVRPQTLDESEEAIARIEVDNFGRRRRASTGLLIPRYGRSCCNCKVCESANCETESSTKTPTGPVEGKSRIAARRSGSCTGRKAGWRFAPSMNGGWPQGPNDPRNQP